MKKLSLIIAAGITLTIMSCGGGSGNTTRIDSVKDSVEKQEVEELAWDGVENSEVAGESMTITDPVVTQMVYNGKPTVIDFNADWCGPCQVMKPIFHKLAKEFCNEYNFVSINVDDNKALAEKYHIQSIPAFIFIDEDGTEGYRITGAVDEKELREALEHPSWF